MPKFQIELDDTTYEALTGLALEELRQVPQQAAWVLMQVLRERRAQRRGDGQLSLCDVGEGARGVTETCP